MIKRNTGELVTTLNRLFLEGAKTCPDCQQATLLFSVDEHYLRAQCTACPFNATELFGG